MTAVAEPTFIPDPVVEQVPQPTNEVHEWITGRTLDPQGRTGTLAAGNGHSLGAYKYVGGDDIWRYAGRHCTHCGALAAYGNRRTGKTQPRFRMAIWGSALTERCPWK
jgi:hypothetical protein